MLDLLVESIPLSLCNVLLCLLLVFDLKYILSDLCIATPTSFLFAWNGFFHPLVFSSHVSLDLKWVSCRQHIYGSCCCFKTTTLLICSHYHFVHCLMIVFIVLFCFFFFSFLLIWLFFCVTFGFLFFMDSFSFLCLSVVDFWLPWGLYISTYVLF